MTSMKSMNVVLREPLGASAATMEAQMPPEHLASEWVREAIHLDRGDLLRIRDGQGTQLTPASGVLWITEEECANDTVLLPGDSHRIENAGLALVLAHRPARVMLEVLPGESPPRRVDVTLAGGEPGPPIALGPARPRSLRTVAAAIAAAVRKAVASGHGVPPWNDQPRSAREPASRDYPFPYY